MSDSDDHRRALRCRDLDGVSRFADRAEIYARSRPSYPPAAIDFILADVSRPLVRIVDVGAGTAISTRLLAGANRRVVGIDPGVEMLGAASQEAGMNLAVGRAERLPFGSGSMDLVTAFNAFHWFQPQPFFEEARRVLVADGRLALAWNDWNRDDAFTDAFVRLMRSRAGDYPPEDRDAEVAPLYATSQFADIEAGIFENIHTLDLPGLRLRLGSMSYIPREGPDWDALSVELTRLFDRFADEAGLVRHCYRTAVYVASPTAG